jgi:hypothetical protein
VDVFDLLDTFTSFIGMVVAGVVTYLVLATVVVLVIAGIALGVEWLRDHGRRVVRFVRQPSLLARPISRWHPGLQRYLLRRAQQQTERAMVRHVLDTLLRDWQGRR